MALVVPSEMLLVLEVGLELVVQGMVGVAMMVLIVVR